MAGRVSIGISADPSGATQAFSQIQAAIKAAGLEGKRLAEVLASAHPALAPVRDDLQRMQAQLEQLRRARGDTGAATRQITHEAGGPEHVDVLNLRDRAAQIFADQRDLRRYEANAGAFLIRGTQWAPPPSPGPSPAPGQPDPQHQTRTGWLYGLDTWLSRRLGMTGRGSGGGGGGGGGSGGGEEGGTDKGLLSGILDMGGAGGLLKATKFGLALAGISALGGMAVKGLGNAQDEAVSNDRLSKTLRDAGTDFETLRRQVRDTADAFGLTFQEAQRYSLEWARLTNETSGRATQAGVSWAAGVARSYGQDPGEVVQGLGRAAKQGEDPRRFAALVGEAVRESGMTGRFGEVMDALVRWTEQSNRQLADRSNVDLFAGMYSSLSSLGRPGLQGQGAEDVLNRINAVLTQGGGAGEASRHLTYRALTRAGVTDPWEWQRIEEGGMFARIRRRRNERGELEDDPTAPTLFEAKWEEANRMYTGRPETPAPRTETQQQANRRRAGIARDMGLTIRQVEAFEQAAPGGDIGRLFPTIERAGISMSDVNPGALQPLITLAGENREQMEARRRGLLEDSTIALPPERREALQRAGTDDELRTALAQAINARGLEANDGTRTVEAMASFSNTLTGAMTGLVAPINDLKTVISAIARPLTRISEALGEGYNRPPIEAVQGAGQKLGSWLREWWNGKGEDKPASPPGVTAPAAIAGQPGAAQPSAIPSWQRPAGQGGQAQQVPPVTRPRQLPPLSADELRAQGIEVTEGALPESERGEEPIPLVPQRPREEEKEEPETPQARATREDISRAFQAALSPRASARPATVAPPEPMAPQRPRAQAEAPAEEERPAPASELPGKPDVVPVPPASPLPEPNERPPHPPLVERPPAPPEGEPLPEGPAALPTVPPQSAPEPPEPAEPQAIPPREPADLPQPLPTLPPPERPDWYVPIPPPERAAVPPLPPPPPPGPEPLATVPPMGLVEGPPRGEPTAIEPRRPAPPPNVSVNVTVPPPAPGTQAPASLVGAVSSQPEARREAVPVPPVVSQNPGEMRGNEPRVSPDPSNAGAAPAASPAVEAPGSVDGRGRQVDALGRPVGGPAPAAGQVAPSPGQSTAGALPQQPPAVVPGAQAGTGVGPVFRPGAGAGAGGAGGVGGAGGAGAPGESGRDGRDAAQAPAGRPGVQAIPPAPLPLTVPPAMPGAPGAGGAGGQAIPPGPPPLTAPPAAPGAPGAGGAGGAGGEGTAGRDGRNAAPGGAGAGARAIPPGPVPLAAPPAAPGVGGTTPAAPGAPTRHPGIVPTAPVGAGAAPVLEPGAGGAGGEGVAGQSGRDAASALAGAPGAQAIPPGPSPLTVPPAASGVGGATPTAPAEVGRPGAQPVPPGSQPQQPMTAPPAAPGAAPVLRPGAGGAGPQVIGPQPLSAPPVAPEVGRGGAGPAAGAGAGGAGGAGAQGGEGGSGAVGPAGERGPGAVSGYPPASVRPSSDIIRRADQGYARQPGAPGADGGQNAPLPASPAPILPPPAGGAVAPLPRRPSRVPRQGEEPQTPSAAGAGGAGGEGAPGDGGRDGRDASLPAALPSSVAPGAGSQLPALPPAQGRGQTAAAPPSARAVAGVAGAGAIAPAPAPTPAPTGQPIPPDPQPLTAPPPAQQRTLGDRFRRLFGVTPTHVDPSWRPIEGDPVPAGWSAPGWAERDGKAVPVPEAGREVMPGTVTAPPLDGGHEVAPPAESAPPGAPPAVPAAGQPQAPAAAAPPLPATPTRPPGAAVRRPTQPPPLARAPRTAEEAAAGAPIAQAGEVEAARTAGEQAVPPPSEAAIVRDPGERYALTNPAPLPGAPVGGSAPAGGNQAAPAGAPAPNLGRPSAPQQPPGAVTGGAGAAPETGANAGPAGGDRGPGAAPGPAQPGTPARPPGLAAQPRSAGRAGAPAAPGAAQPEGQPGPSAQVPQQPRGDWRLPENRPQGGGWIGPSIRRQEHGPAAGTPMEGGAVSPELTRPGRGAGGRVPPGVMGAQEGAPGSQPGIGRVAFSPGANGGVSQAPQLSPPGAGGGAGNGAPIGSLSARFESARAGATAIGRDSTGGWSYGTYQFASARGSVEPFLATLRREAPDIAARLDAAGGSRAALAGTAQFRQAWQQAATDPRFAGIEHAHIQATHYNPLARTAGELGIDLQGRSAALRDVVWSTAVQHGPGRSLNSSRGPTGGASVLQDAVRSLGARTPEQVARLTDEQISQAIYAQRRTRFSNSTPNERASVMRRFDQEGALALRRIGEERAAIAAAPQVPRPEAAAGAAQGGAQAMPPGAAMAVPPGAPRPPGPAIVPPGAPRPPESAIVLPAAAHAPQPAADLPQAPTGMPSPEPATAASGAVPSPGYGTALPPEERARLAEQGSPGMAGAGAGAQQISVSTSANIAPLRVVHETDKGEDRGEEFLPVTAYEAPKAWGASA
ncbi:conserved protein of unknown function (plasmid) [Rhodovastum atsumiense]|uniref:Type VI secretion system spike protein VgrG3-like C-terminal domain-containing protein n=1 Tax=Rhodovastum atsumiense TaxID=504468 RepID=A0A5M6IUN2_9PROT|nr:hypothetical protein [Rhodovastum atsumiense]KAA5611577.1 hypothetical protein F1189_13515 [Rhodovastum atsumiense]CAH2606340.1 conserved protein of unknown function [Rhodovastum atsumiense]